VRTRNQGNRGCFCARVLHTHTSPPLIPSPEPPSPPSGENNVGEDDFYACAFPLLVNSWREAFGAPPTTPFFFVQLPAYVRSNDTFLASFREAQLSIIDQKTAPNVFYISTVDLGDAYDGSIHNRDKAAVGARMGAAVLANLYNVSSAPWRSPRYGAAYATTQGTTVTVNVTVDDPRSLYDGLVVVPPSFDSNATWCPNARGVEDISCDWFAVQTSDGTWHNATAAPSADGRSLVLTAVTSTPGLAAVATRNGYADWPVTSVYNSAGLPLVPWTPRNVTTSVVL
jgi:hypothetical protein